MSSLFKKIGHDTKKFFGKNGTLQKFAQKSVHTVDKGLGYLDKGLEQVDKLDIPVLDNVVHTGRQGLGIARTVNGSIGALANSNSTRELGTNIKNTYTTAQNLKSKIEKA